MGEPETRVVTKSRVQHEKTCKICMLPKAPRDIIDAMLLEGRTDGEVVNYAHTQDIPLDYYNIYHHRKLLPAIASDGAIAYLLAKAREASNDDVHSQVRATAIKRMEFDAVVATMHAITAEEYTKAQMWTGALPALIGEIQKQALEGKAPIKDLAYALDVIVKNALLIGGAPTARVEVNQRSEPKEDTASLTASIRASLEAIDRANKAILVNPDEGGEDETSPD